MCLARSMALEERIATNPSKFDQKWMSKVAVKEASISRNCRFDPVEIHTHPEIPREYTEFSWFIANFVDTFHFYKISQSKNPESQLKYIIWRSRSQKPEPKRASLVGVKNWQIYRFWTNMRILVRRLGAYPHPTSSTQIVKSRQR